MKINTYILMICLISTYQVHSENQPQELNFWENVAIGGIVGATEVVFPGQPLSYAMNQTIKREPCNWRHAYNGIFANAAGQMPITAIQKIAQVEGTKYMQNLQDEPLCRWQKASISYFAGVAGALVDTPSNAIQLYLQNPNNAQKNTSQAVRALGRNNYRGFWANALIKEGPFAVGYQFLAPQAKAVATEYIDNEMAASVAGGISAGVFTAAITQPGAVIRNKMQNGEMNVIENTLRNEGIKGFYKGLLQRGTRIMFAIPLYAVCSNYLETKIKNR